VCVCIYCVHLGAHIHQRTHSYTRHEGFGDGQSADEMAQWKGTPLPAGWNPLSAGCNLRTSRRGCRERLWRLLCSEPYGGAGRTTPNCGLQKTNTGWRGCIGYLICTGDFPQKSPMIGNFFAKRDLEFEASSAPSPPCSDAAFAWGESESNSAHAMTTRQAVITNDSQRSTFLSVFSQTSSRGFATCRSASSCASHT